MKYKFICDEQYGWYTEIREIEQLLNYWKDIFNPKLQTALQTIKDTKEYGMGTQHCDSLQLLIGAHARGNKISNQQSHESITYDYRLAQYKALCTYGCIYINKNMGWNIEPKLVTQFIYKDNIEFPIMKADRIKIEQFPLGKHYYVFIDGIQLRNKEQLKFNSYSEAFEYAQQYIT